MKKYIALIRGINVSGQKKLKMEDLRTMCTHLGYNNVITYIQSGNIVFDAKKEGLSKIETTIKEQILETFGYEVKVMVRAQEYFQEVLQYNPFLGSAVDIRFLHVTFLAGLPELGLVEKLEETDYGTDEFRVVNDRVYLHFPNGYGRTKLSNNAIENKLRIDATTRNWRTVNKLNEMALDG